MGAPGHVIGFDEFELDLARFELRHRGVPVELERQVFDLLAYLVQAEGRVVTKEELLDNVWGTRFVTESALTTQIKFARRALGDDGTRQRFIRTVHRRGYEFVARPDRGSPANASADESRGPGGSLERAAANLPRALGPELVGRDAAIADLVGLLERSRLVTVTGPGGVGKTQLALAAAASVAERFEDGIVPVDLSPLTDPADIWRVAADAADIGRREGVAVADALAETRSLVLIDNCEHLVDDVAGFVDRLLARPDDPVRILATSREPLGVLGEQLMMLDPLPVSGGPDRASAAARLFLERAGPAAAGVDLAAVERLVTLLDGLPLAIELAAAQLGFMGLPELHRRLEQHRFALERHRRRSSRHDSLAESVAWSWQLLDDTERRALVELSAFPGDFGLDAAERIATVDHPIAVLRRLHAKSLVANARRDTTTRFRLLFGVRDFVTPHQDDLPGGSSGLRRRLASVYADWLDEWSVEDQWTSFEYLDVALTERSTIREITASRDPEIAVETARVAAASAAMHRFGFGVSHGRSLSRSIDLAGLPHDVAARVALAGSEAWYAVGDVAAKDRLAAEALERSVASGRDDLVALAMTQQCIGHMIDQADRSCGLLDEAARHARAAGAPRLAALALGLQASCRLAGGAPVDEARRVGDEADRLAAPWGWDRIAVTTFRGIARLLDGDRAGAAAEYAATAAALEPLELHAAAALFRTLEVTCRADTASADEIRTVVDDFLRRYRRATGHAGRADVLLLFAHRAVHSGDPKRAAKLVEAIRGRRLAHQVSLMILGDVAARVGAPPIVVAVPPAASTERAPVLDELVDAELAALV